MLQIININKCDAYVVCALCCLFKYSKFSYRLNKSQINYISGEITYCNDVKVIKHKTINKMGMKMEIFY